MDAETKAKKYGNVRTAANRINSRDRKFFDSADYAQQRSNQAAGAAPKTAPSQPQAQSKPQMRSQAAPAPRHEPVAMEIVEDDSSSEESDKE